MGEQVGCREGEPDRPAAPKQLAGVSRGLIVAEYAQGRGRREQGTRSEQEVESDHVAVELAQLAVQAHAAIQAHSAPAKKGNPPGQRNQRPWPGLRPSRIRPVRASRTSSRSASTISRAPRRTWRATSSIT